MSNRSAIFKTGFPRVPLGLGIGRYVCQLQRITIKFCKNHGTSRGMRNFLEHDLIDFAKANPGTVVYVKPRRHKTPVLVAEYLSGERQFLSCKDFTRDEIVRWIELLRTQFHDGSQLRWRKLWHTEYPSIQGPWTPITFRDPKENLAKFPNNELGAAVKLEITATEKVIELFKAQQISKECESESSEDKSLQKGSI